MHKILLMIDLSEEYGRSLMQGIVRYSNEQGPWVFCRMPLYYREVHGISGILKWAKEWGADGIIASLNSNTDVQQILSAGIPTIAQDYKERFRGIPNITGQYFETGQMGARYFLSKGYRHFAFYGFRDIVWSRERANGFEETVRKEGYSVHYFENERRNSNDLWYYKPSPLSQWLLSLPKNVALMACDDNQGQHIIEACKAVGIRVPDDLVVLGVDNDEMVCNLSEPSLSSISLSTEQGGFEAAELLRKMIRSRTMEHGNVLIKPTGIITRKSTDIYSTDDELVTRALKYIHANIARNIGVEDVLEQIPLSRRALEMRFAKATGLPIYKYIKRLRIDRIADQLLKTNKRISEIAVEFCLDDCSNVSRSFRKEKGASPEKFRELHRVTLDI